LNFGLEPSSNGEKIDSSKRRPRIVLLEKMNLLLLFRQADAEEILFLQLRQRILFRRPTDGGTSMPRLLVRVSTLFCYNSEQARSCLLKDFVVLVREHPSWDVLIYVIIHHTRDLIVGVGHLFLQACYSSLLLPAI
jgi:hypothetical protein